MCVIVHDVEALKAHLDEQLGSIGAMGPCTYTADDGHRNHFVKSIDEAWQDEFRMFWLSIKEPRLVQLRAQTGSWVAIPNCVEMTRQERERVEQIRAEFEATRERRNRPRPIPTPFD